MDKELSNNLEVRLVQPWEFWALLISQQGFRASVAAEANRIIYTTFPTKVSDSGFPSTHSSTDPRFCNNLRPPARHHP